jgi:hypothetical protein
MHKGLTLLAASSIAVASPSVAQMQDHQPATVCPATPAKLPTELASWASPSETNAATTAESVAATELIIGQATDLDLAPTSSVSYAMRPERPGGSVSHGGMAAIHVEKAGIYRVAIDSAAWLDVVSDGKGLESVNHGHGPDCSGIRKMVDFKLEPGLYVLQIVGNGAPKLRVLVTRVPAA